MENKNESPSQEFILEVVLKFPFFTTPKKKVDSESFFSSDPDSEMDAKSSLALGELLGFNNLIIEQIKTTRGLNSSEDIKKLAALNKGEWKAELGKSADKLNIAGAPVDKNIINLLADALVKKFESEYPTEAFFAQLERENNPILKNQEAIKTFYSKHHNFDLQHSNIDSFINNKGMATKEEKAVGEELKMMQRIFKLVPHYSKMNALLKENIRSAQSIAAKGESCFVNEIAPKAGINTKEAKDIFKNAMLITFKEYLNSEFD